MVGELRRDGSLITVDDDSGQGTNFRISRGVLPGSYSLYVDGYQDGVYTVRSSFSGARTYYYDLSPDGGASLSLSRGDTHVYNIAVSNSGTLVLESSGFVNLTGTLYRDGTEITSDENSGSRVNFRISQEVTPGVYSLYIAGDDGDDNGDYTISSRHATASDVSYTVAQERRVVEAYIAYYGRPPDREGLAYWAQQLAGSGGSLNSIIQAFGVSEEFELRFGSLSNRQLVTNLYQQLFGRNPDSGGLDFYVNRLNDGTTTLQAIAISILDGAQNDDLTIIENRREASNCFLEYSQLSSVSIGAGQIANILSSVDHRDSTVTAACNSYERLHL